MWGKMKPKERKYLVFQERGCPLFNISVGSICTHTHLRTPLGTSLPPLCLLGFFFSLCSTFKQQENRKRERERRREEKMQIEELVFVGSLGWFGAAAAIAMPLLLF